jgi:hypothetical protein
MSDNEMEWLAGHQLQSFTNRECDWVAVFDGDAKLTITCLWRLIESGRVRRTSLDEGQWFGLPAPVDAAAAISSRLTGEFVESVTLNSKTLDLDIQFGTGHILQVIADSSGYEAWTSCGGGKLVVAAGGGNLAVFDNG